MTWRRFIVLLGGLSPTSLWVLLVRDDATPKSVRRIDDPVAAEAYVLSIAGGRP